MKQRAPESATPTSCPDCLSTKIKGPDQVGTGLSYWRCLSCGIVWNPERPPERGSSALERPSSPRSVRQKDPADYDYWKNR